MSGTLRSCTTRFVPTTTTSISSGSAKSASKDASDWQRRSARKKTGSASDEAAATLTAKGATPMPTDLGNQVCSSLHSRRYFSGLRAMQAVTAKTVGPERTTNDPAASAAHPHLPPLLPPHSAPPRLTAHSAARKCTYGDLPCHQGPHPHPWPPSHRCTNSLHPKKKIQTSSLDSVCLGPCRRRRRRLRRPAKRLTCAVWPCRSPRRPSRWPRPSQRVRLRPRRWRTTPLRRLRCLRLRLLDPQAWARARWMRGSRLLRQSPPSWGRWRARPHLLSLYRRLPLRRRYLGWRKNLPRSDSLFFAPRYSID
jgi:hypothetical protein